MKKKNGYNISHIKLIKLIKKDKLKENTRIYISDCPEAFVYKKGTLYFCGEPANFKMFIENIKYAKFRIGDTIDEENAKSNKINEVEKQNK